MFWLRFWMFGAIWVAWFCCSLLLIAADHPITDPEEVSALKEVKKSLVDWDRNLDNWKHGDPCTSNWIGVLCFDTTKDDGYLHVKELLLLNMSLSGSLSPELGRFSHLEILDVMWNKISGTIPKEIGNISSLQLLLLNGNQLTGFLPEELGYLPNLDRIQIDENQISGPIPASFSNLKLAKHFHMNNNSLSGQIPTELSRLPKLVHLLLDNNNLSGHLPRELAQMPNLRILQLDNNRFDGSTIPASYSNMSRLLKLSLRNCGLIGTVPDLSRIPNLTYIDLSSNQLNGSISPYRLSENITTIDLSNNSLTGTIPSNFSGLPRLQILSLAYNRLNGSVQSIIWQSRTFHRNDTFILDFKNNTLSNISGSLDHLPNVRIRLQGNPICSNPNMVEFCGNRNEFANDILNSTNSTGSCTPNACPQFYEYAPEFPEPERCSCLLPVLVGFRLKSPGFSIFQPYIDRFEEYLTSGLQLKLYQLHIDSFVWEKGPRLNMYLKIFPAYNNHEFNTSEVLRLQALFSGWTIRDNEFFGPHELLGFTLVDRYRDAIPRSSSYISKGALAGIILAAIAGSVILSAIVSILIWRVQMRKFHPVSKRRELSKLSIKIDGVKDFSYEEMMMATNNFDRSSEVGHGGYGKVYKGILADGTVVAIKRAQEGSLQGVKEFLTEIELLSRLHHRNLVSLLGYCDEEGEQMLVYEFMCNGTLREHLSGKFKVRLSFAMRLKIALDSAKGILYLHTEADPPIFHRDIKATNILLDSKLTAKVADFGLSRLAPVPDIEGTVPAYVSTVVKGTPGYLDPEYFLTHMLTDKSDVYSLGVVFLELLTGMQPISHGKNIVREVNNAYRSGIIFSIIDEKMGFYPSQCVEKFVTLALKCCQEETDSRPSMANVVWELETIWLLMPESDTTTTTIDSSSISDSVTTLPSSSSTSKSPYISDDVYGSYLDGGVISNITPR